MQRVRLFGAEVKKSALFCLFIIVSVFALAQQQPWWYTLEQGKLHFRGGAYGNALMAFEDARRERLAQYTRMEQDMIRLLSLPEVRRLGDSLELVERYIAERNQAEAAAALAELYYRFPKPSLGGSARRVLEELDRLKSYPEADYWLGETYRAEGELVLALGQYKKAWDKRALLETPGFDVEILYKIAELHRLRREYQEMEERANEIVNAARPDGAPWDSFWAGSGRTTLRAAMSRILENEGVNRFLTLYRYNNTLTEKAHRLLGFYYYVSSRHPLAVEHLMFAFLVQNTILLDEITRRQYDYTFTDLNNLMEAALLRPELVIYLDETEYFRTVYYLASALYATGRMLPARQLWSFLAGRSEAGEWRGRSAGQLRNPYIDRAVEMP
jgi:tetratricopeptide (TPR) repeat protein